MRIKFGFRESLLYPGLFVLFLAIRRMIKYILELLLLSIKLSYFLVLTLFISEILIGSIYIFINYRKIIFILRVNLWNTFIYTR